MICFLSACDCQQKFCLRGNSGTQRSVVSVTVPRYSQPVLFTFGSTMDDANAQTRPCHSLATVVKDASGTLNR